MIIELCMKYEFNTPMLSKDIERKLFRTYVRYVCSYPTYVRTAVILYTPPPPILMAGA